MKLYKFRQVDTYSLSGLSNSTLWFSDLNDFNDPFEGSYVLDDTVSDYVRQNLLSRATPKPDSEIDVVQRDRMLDEAGVTGDDTQEDIFLKMLRRDFEKALIGTVHKSKAICMSQYSSEQDPLYENLMWSHYASGLRGFCLVFDSEQLQQGFYERELTIRPIEVEYQDHPVTLSLDCFARSRYILNDNPMTDTISDVTKTIGTKSNAWAYEREFRLLSLEDSNVHSYTPEALIEIVIGEKMPKDQQKLVIDTAKSANPSVVIKKAQLKRGTYQLEIVDYN
ncbi:hypothetical protein VoSk93_39850 [Vibrio owensii]